MSERRAIRRPRTCATSPLSWGWRTFEFIYAEGLAVSEANKQHGIAGAHAHIDRLAKEELETV
jgi:hypothetical protein